MTFSKYCIQNNSSGSRTSSHLEYTSEGKRVPWNATWLIDLSTHSQRAGKVTGLATGAFLFCTHANVKSGTKESDPLTSFSSEDISNLSFKNTAVESQIKSMEQHITFRHIICFISSCVKDRKKKTKRNTISVIGLFTSVLVLTRLVPVEIQMNPIELITKIHSVLKHCRKIQKTRLNRKHFPIH